MPQLIGYFSNKYANKELITNYQGKILIKTNLSDHIESQIFWQDVQEGDRGEVALMKKILNDGDVFIDIGANVGVFSLIAAAHNQNGQIHAFEPYSYHYNRLKQNVSINNFQNIAINCLALSDTHSKLDLFIPNTNNTGMASLFADTDHYSNYKKEKVFVTTLDIYAKAKQLQRLDLIKLDVEGAELKVLKGCKTLINRHNPLIMMEVNKEHLKRAECSYLDVLNFFNTYNYNIYKINHNGKLSRILSEENLSAHQNIFCLPKTSNIPNTLISMDRMVK